MKKYKKAVRQGEQEPSNCPFDHWLEKLGLFINGQPDQSLSLVPVIGGDPPKQCGWAHRFTAPSIDDVATGKDWLSDVIELIVPKYKLFIECRSDLYTADDTIPQRYHMYRVTWKQGKTLHKGTALYSGNSTRWRKYHAARAETEMCEPWIWFDAKMTADGLRVGWREGHLARYLHMVASQTVDGRSPAKLDMKIIRVMYALDPDAFPFAVTSVTEAYPQLQPSLYGMLPKRFSFSDEEYGIKAGYTVFQIAEELDTSQSTVRRIIKERDLSPVLTRRPHVYNREAKRTINASLISRDAKRCWG